MIGRRTVASLLVALLVAACGGGFQLGVGDCAQVPPEGPDRDGMARITIVDCDEPHELEVFHVFELGPEQLTDEAMVRAIADVCLGDAWTDYLGVAAEESPLELLPIPPPTDALASGDDREVVCTVREPGSPRRTGSLRASGAATALSDHLDDA